MKLTAHERRHLAVASCSHPKTIDRFLNNPDSVKSTSRARIEAAMVQLGFDLQRAEEPSDVDQ